MTLLEDELGEMPNEKLRKLAGSVTPTVAAAAQAELDSRPTASAARGEAWIREVFPSRPDPFA